MFDTDRERRVLAHLPVWAADEDAFIKAELEGGAERSIRSFTLPEMHARLVEHDTQHSGVVIGEDAHGAPARRALEQDEVEKILLDLQAKGYASLDGDDWRMTAEGFKALTTDEED